MLDNGLTEQERYILVGALYAFSFNNFPVTLDICEGMAVKLGVVKEFTEMRARWEAHILESTRRGPGEMPA